MEYTYIKPQELRGSWEYIKKGLSKILKKSPEQWIAEVLQPSGSAAATGTAVG